MTDRHLIRKLKKDDEVNIICRNTGSKMTIKIMEIWTDKKNNTQSTKIMFSAPDEFIIENTDKS